VAVAYSLAQSQYIDSHQLLLAKLPTTVTDILSFAEVHGDILSGLANMIALSQVTPSFDYIFICCEY
jgi:isocitrate/isopropylmalate dehydrogenase